jgi:Rrf2 family transcriptional regulator, cysteine metabolism repressor
MSKISQKCEYGLRVLLELTKRQGQGPVSVTEIAAVQAIPQRFLELIVKELREASVVVSYRGAKGGYVLAADPARLTLGQVIRLLDGPFGPMDCMACGGERYCTLQGGCSLSEVWRKAEHALADVYDSVTFRHLADEQPAPAAQVAVVAVGG